MKLIDKFLNNITMYRLLFYYLLVLVGVAVVYTSRGALPFTPSSLIFSTIFLFLVCYITNKLFAAVFSVPANVESVYITALILALILTPAKAVSGYDLLFWAGVLAIASKFILAINKKHLFNPAAIAVVITAFAVNQSASWWVGTSSMLPFVLVGGLLLVRKIKRDDLVLSFVFVAMGTILIFSYFKGSDLFTIGKTVLLNSPLLFLAFVMLTEPSTTPPTKKLQILYGALIGFLFAPQVHFQNFYTTPELALVFGNVFSYLVSSKAKLALVLKEKIQVAPDIYDFVFSTKQKLAFAPGQYLEWTLPAQQSDSRGNRRYFTLASAPTEKEIRIGVKFYQNPSSFKKTLGSLKTGDQILAGQLSGDFVLPTERKQKAVLIAGGIGITPFRSMIKYLLDKQEKRDLILFYSNKTEKEIAYQEILESAGKELGIRTVYALTDRTQVPVNWPGRVGYIDEPLIKSEVPDWQERTFYLSGPRSMVEAFEETLQNMGVRSGKIKTDFFPGFA